MLDAAISPHFIVHMARREGEALLVDPGSPGNLAGDRWVQRMREECRRQAMPEPRHTDIPEFTVGGVGKHAQVCTQKASVPVGLSNGTMGTYEAPEVPQSDVPGLLGLDTLVRLHALLDCAGRKLFLVGPGGYKLQLSPGSMSCDLEVANTGHLLLPCTDYQKGGNGERMTFATVPGHH